MRLIRVAEMNAEENASKNHASAKSIEALGTLSFRAPVGHGPRRLQRGRHGLGIFPARSSPRSRAHRWGEDGAAGHHGPRKGPAVSRLGLLGWPRSCILERSCLFGLTNPLGNHGEDVKEYYFYLDSTPTHSYMKALYKASAGRISLRQTGGRERPQEPARF